MRQLVQGLLGMVVLLVLAVFVMGPAHWAFANNSAPDGWYPNRTRMKYALGTPHQYWADASATNTVKPTGVEVGDIIAGIANMDDTSETMADLDNIAVTANTLTSSDTPFTATERYLVTVWRPQADSR